MTALLQVQELQTFYGDAQALFGVGLSVAEGEFVTMLGRNGMGKTTLIRSIFGLTPPRLGSVEYKGQSLIGLAPFRIAQMGLALVPQGRRIFKNLSVLENLQLPTSSLAGSRTKKADTHTNENRWTREKILDEFPQLRDRLQNGGNELSGGEQQMLAIGRKSVV